MVTYNSRRFLPDFFTSLSQNTSYPFRLIVIDNYSTDHSRDYLSRISRTHPLKRHLKLVFNSRNLGLAKAWNQGIKLGDSAYLVFLNPDIILTSGWLNRLVDCAKRKPQAAVVGAKIVNYNGIIAHAGFLNKLVLGRGQPVDNSLWNLEMEVDGIHGCCFLVKRAFLSEYGAFDERFFLYAEEDDLCTRVKNAGYQVVVCPVPIYHYGAGSAVSPKRRAQYHQASLKKFVEKWNQV
jgi:GT2 family glycosyltransferase